MTTSPLRITLLAAAVAALLAIPAASAESAVRLDLPVDVLISAPGGCPPNVPDCIDLVVAIVQQAIAPAAGCLRPNVPDCIDFAAEAGKDASDRVGHLVCDILCDDDGNLIGLAVAN